MKKDFSINAITIIGALGVLLGVFWINISLDFPKGSADGVPGAGSFPIATSVLLIGLAIIMIMTSIKENRLYFNFREMAYENKLALLLTIVACAIFIVLWYFTSYIVASFALTTMLGVLYRIRFSKAVAFAACFSVGTYFFFSKVLQVLLLAR